MWNAKWTAKPRPESPARPKVGPQPPTEEPRPQPPPAPAAASPAPAARALDAPRVATWIGQSVVLKGDLSGSEDMQIDGRVEGAIELRHHEVIVGANAKVRADIVAKSIVIRGTVTGTLKADDKIDILETAAVDGDLTAARLAIADGATVEGRLRTATVGAKSSKP